jgi:hypothetical protein
MTTLEKALFQSLLQVMDAVWSQASNEPAHEEAAPTPAPEIQKAA